MTYTAFARLQKPATADQGWDATLNANFDTIDGFAAIGPLSCTTTETPSSTLSCMVAPGSFLASTGVMVASPSQTFAAPPAGTTLVWITEAGVVGSGLTWPSAPACRIASVVSGPTSIISIADARLVFRSTVVPAPAIANGSDATVGAILAVLRQRGLIAAN